jgi:hypothetical protein
VKYVPFLNPDIFSKKRTVLTLIAAGVIAFIGVVSSGYFKALAWRQNASPLTAGELLGFTQPPTISKLKTIEINYAFASNITVAKLFLSIQKAGDKYSLSLPLNNRSQGGAEHYDLTPSRFAGDPVTLTLIGYTQEGREIISRPVTLRLPERDFTHPAARKIIAIRRHIWQDLSTLPQRADELHEVTRHPADLDDNLTVFVALRSAVWRLRQDDAWQDVNSTIDLLWEAALDLERGKMAAKANTQA